MCCSCCSWELYFPEACKCVQEPDGTVNSDKLCLGASLAFGACWLEAQGFRGSKALGDLLKALAIRIGSCGLA